MEPKKISIKTVLNGWRVKVGCQEVVFTNKQEMLAEISAYLDDPVAMENKYKESTNYKHFQYAHLNVVTFIPSQYRGESVIPHKSSGDLG